MGSVDTYAGEIFSSDNSREVWKMRQVFWRKTGGERAIEKVRNAFVIGQSICIYFKCHKVVCSIPTRANIFPKQFCMHSGRMSQCCINIARNTFIEKENQRRCYGPAVRINGNKPKGENMIIWKKTKRNEKQLYNIRTWTISWTEGRLLTTMISGKIILFKVFPREILPIDAVWSWWSYIYHEIKDMFEED